MAARRCGTVAPGAVRSSPADARWMLRAAPPRRRRPRRRTMSKSASAPVTCNGRVTAREAATSRSRPPSAARPPGPADEHGQPAGGEERHAGQVDHDAGALGLRRRPAPRPGRPGGAARWACRSRRRTSSRTVPGRGRDTSVSSGRPAPKGSGAAASDTTVHLRWGSGRTVGDPTAERADPAPPRSTLPARRPRTVVGADRNRRDEPGSGPLAAPIARSCARALVGRSIRLNRCWVPVPSEHPPPTRRGCRRCCTTPRRRARDRPGPAAGGLRQRRGDRVDRGAGRTPGRRRRVERRRGPDRSRRPADERDDVAALARRRAASPSPASRWRCTTPPGAARRSARPSGRRGRAACSGSPGSPSPERGVRRSAGAGDGRVPAAVGHRAGRPAPAGPAARPRGDRHRDVVHHHRPAPARTTRWSGSTPRSPASPATGWTRSSAATAGCCRGPTPIRRPSGGSATPCAAARRSPRSC